MVLSFASLEKARAKLSEYNRTYPYLFGLREGLNDLGVSFLECDIRPREGVGFQSVWLIAMTYGSEQRNIGNKGGIVHHHRGACLFLLCRRSLRAIGERTR